MVWLVKQHVQHLHIVALPEVKAVRVDCWHQVKVHTIHNVSSPWIGCVVLAQPLCQPKQQLPAALSEVETWCQAQSNDCIQVLAVLFPVRTHIAIW